MPQISDEDRIKFVKAIDLLKSALTADQQKKVRELFIEYRNCFSTSNTNIGKTTIGEFKIRLKDPEAPPINKNFYRTSPAQWEEIRRQIRDMLATGVIKPSISPYSFSHMLVAKKDGSISYCMDFRLLNAATIPDIYPLPRVDDMLEQFSGSMYFTTIDIRSAYWQLPMEERSKELTAFATPDGGLYEYQRWPFSLMNAPAAF